MKIIVKRTGVGIPLTIPARPPEFKNTRKQLWIDFPIMLDGVKTELKYESSYGLRFYFMRAGRMYFGQRDQMGELKPLEDCSFDVRARKPKEAPPIEEIEGTGSAKRPEGVFTYVDEERAAKEATDAAVADGRVIRVSTPEEAANAVSSLILGSLEIPTKTDEAAADGGPSEEAVNLEEVPSSAPEGEADFIIDIGGGISLIMDASAHAAADLEERSPATEGEGPLGFGKKVEIVDGLVIGIELAAPAPAEIPKKKSSFQERAEELLDGMTTKLPTRDVLRRLQKNFPFDVEGIGPNGLSLKDGTYYELSRKSGKFILKEGESA